MRNETGEWLAPLIEAANHNTIEVPPLLRHAPMPAAEADAPAA